MTKVVDITGSIAPFVQGKFFKLDLHTPFENAAIQLGQRQESRCFVVDEQSKLVGLFRQEDFVSAIITKKSKNAKISEIMTKEPRTLSSAMSLSDAVAFLSSHKLSWAPVVDGDHIKGLVELTDLLEPLSKELKSLKDDNKDLKNQLNYKDDYLGVVSHDVRTPLSVISLCCDYLLSTSSKKILSGDQLSFVERIRRNTKNATDMVTDILDIVRLEKGFSLDYVDTNIDEFLGECIGNLQVIANEKNIEVLVECQEHIVVSLDRRRIIHVLENLVNNAVKFSPKGKKIFIEAYCEIKDGQSYLVFSVRDEGLGIKDDDKGKIFDKFNQLESGVEKTLGVGLGLSIAKKFVSLHRGFMEVDGGWQKGATFKAYIPGAKSLTDHVPMEKRDKVRVLVVEDDVSIREYFEEELIHAGYDVVIATDGEEGMHAYFRTKPDVILSDIRMPNVDGLELLAKIRMTDKSVPFILCSGYYPGLAEDLAASEYQANKVLDKPLSTDTVIEVVSELVGKVPAAS